MSGCIFDHYFLIQLENRIFSTLEVTGYPFWALNTERDWATNTED